MIVIDELPKGSLCSGLKWMWEGGVFCFCGTQGIFLIILLWKGMKFIFFTGRTNTPALPLDPHMHCKAEED